ncbi:sigma factor [Flavivirga jejuensis]|uniref:Sigma factor n=1 Tax=Flavivirga jejuensis TaxID=870487 RepID=A0ABT8WIS7_9FLAO|nr:sigma factor [Flavivirga jejuensis]MDO5972867.1 sigma factor [Flavivirga jejuensis]
MSSKEDRNELTLEDYKNLFEGLYPQLCELACKYLNDLESSKDLVEEVFVNVWEDGIVFENENHTTSYFYKAVKNACLNFLKNKTQTFK